MDVDDIARSSEETLTDDAPTRPLGEDPQLLEPGSAIGRYLILNKLGAGGMGVVYAAYDPELDRKVALKLLRGTPDQASSRSSEGRSRLLREAQALAKLAHPEVVAIHDVGEHRVGVWLAMEYIEGKTLGVWARDKSWREILGALLAAGRGVAAAHAAGLVHRDLKPDNIMVGNDGRVRVMDFGLTRTQPSTGTIESPSQALPIVDEGHASASADTSPLTQVGSLLGTPAYMAPEQYAGSSVGPPGDQWSFCVTAWELLYGERPFAGRSVVELASVVLEGRRRSPPPTAKVPAWLRRALERGLSVDQDERWPSMAALLGELGRGQSRRRSRMVLAGLAMVVLAGVGAEGWRRHELSSRIEACTLEGRAIDEIWNPEIRAQVHASMLASKVPTAEVTFDKLVPWLDDHAESWASHRRQACLAARVDETMDADLHERASWCLDERRLEFASLVDQLAHADAQIVDRAVLAAAGLSRLSPCIDPATLASQPAPPSPELRTAVGEIRAELATATARFGAGKYPDALALLEPALARADEIDWPPLAAALLRLQGAVFVKQGRLHEAEVLERQAYLRAAKAGAWEVAADAAIHLITIVGYEQARAEEGQVWAEHASVAIAHAHDGLGLREARRLNGLGVLLDAAGEYPRAKALHEESIAILEAALGPEHPQVAVGLNNLSIVLDSMGERARAEAMLRRALAIRERALGPDHPEVADFLNNLATTVLDPLEARALHERALAISERAFGPNHLDVAESLVNLANIDSRMGDYEQAKVLLLRAIAIREPQIPDHPAHARGLANLANAYHATGENALAKSNHERALAIMEKTLGPDHPDVGQALSNLANTNYSLGELELARSQHERGLAIRERTLGEGNVQLGHPLTGLAQIALDQGRVDDAIALAERAVRVRGGEGVPVDELAESRFVLAQALWAKGEGARAVDIGRLASEGFRADPSQSTALARVDAWLAEHVP